MFILEINRAPIVSIIMPTFNSARFIAASIQSVLNQKFKEWELLVIDGGSTDNTHDIVLRYSFNNQKIRLVLNADDKGPAHARSMGIREARGDYIAFLDGDDLWYPEKLSIQIDFMIRTDTKFSYTKYSIMSSRGTGVSCPLSIHHQYSYPSYLFFRGIGCSTVIVQRALFTDEILETYGPWLGEDTLWWLKIFRGGVLARGIPEPLMLYRDAEGSLSKHRIKNQLSIWRIYRDNFNLSRLVAIAAYVSYMCDVALRRFLCRICTMVSRKKRVEDILK